VDGPGIEKSADGKNKKKTNSRSKMNRNGGKHIVVGHSRALKYDTKILSWKIHPANNGGGAEFS
jgi:hypothetical protein